MLQLLFDAILAVTLRCEYDDYLLQNNGAGSLI